MSFTGSASSKRLCEYNHGRGANHNNQKMKDIKTIFIIGAVFLLAGIIIDLACRAGITEACPSNFIF